MKPISLTRYLIQEQHAGRINADLRLLAFADAGEVHNQDGLACRAGSATCRASSVGVGLRLGWGPVQLRADVARAMQNAITTERGDWRAHVAISASF